MVTSKLAGPHWIVKVTSYSGGDAVNGLGTPYYPTVKTISSTYLLYETLIIIIIISSSRKGSSWSGLWAPRIPSRLFCWCCTTTRTASVVGHTGGGISNGNQLGNSRLLV